MGHLREHGYRVEEIGTTPEELAAKKRTLGVTPTLDACHTAIVDGYVVEGHVSAEVIDQLLNEKPEITGIAVPGMPAGSPGMSGVQTEPIVVYAFDQSGLVSIFARQ